MSDPRALSNFSDDVEANALSNPTESVSTRNGDWHQRLQSSYRPYVCGVIDMAVVLVVLVLAFFVLASIADLNPNLTFWRTKTQTQ